MRLNLGKKLATSSLILSIFFISFGSLSIADGNDGKVLSTAELVDRGFLERIKGRILTNRNVHYTGDPMEISLLFPKGAQQVRNGEVDAYLVIFTPQAEEDAVLVQVNSEASEIRRSLFRLEQVDISTLPAGWYQVGLVITVPGGDPLAINDWHNGLKGLLHTVGIIVSDEAVDYDQDGDGMVDDDLDGDGFGDDPVDGSSNTDETDETDETNESDGDNDSGSGDSSGSDDTGNGSEGSDDGTGNGSEGSDDGTGSGSDPEPDPDDTSDEDSDNGSDSPDDTAGGTDSQALLGRGDLFMPERHDDFYFSNGDTFSSEQIAANMTERFNRYYTDPSWQALRTIYVSPNGSASMAANSESNPSGVDTAVGALEAGDLVYFLPGTYDDFNVRLWAETAGTYDQPIVFYGARNSDGSLGVTLNCSTSGSSHYSSCFNLENSHYVAVDGFEMNGGRYGVRAVGGFQSTNHVIGIAILNNDVHNQCADPIFSGEASWLVVENNDAYEGGVCPTGNVDGHAVYLSNGGDFVIFRRNDLWGNLNSDFQINSDPISTCANDLDTDAICDGNAFNDSEGKGISEFYWIEGNYMHNSPSTGPNFTGVRNSVVVGNVVAFYAAHGVSFWQESDLTAPSGLNPDLASAHNLVEGNIFLNDPRTSSGGRHALQITRHANGNEFINNIIAGGRIVNGSDFVSDNSVVLVEIDSSSADNSFSGNCLIGSNNFDENGAEWPRTLGEDWVTDIDPDWFVDFPFDKMGSIEDWNVTDEAPASCPRLSFPPLD